MKKGYVFLFLFLFSLPLTAAELLHKANQTSQFQLPVFFAESDIAETPKEIPPNRILTPEQNATIFQWICVGSLIGCTTGFLTVIPAVLMTGLGNQQEKEILFICGCALLGGSLFLFITGLGLMIASAIIHYRYAHLAGKNAFFEQKRALKSIKSDTVFSTKKKENINRYYFHIVI